MGACMSYADPEALRLHAQAEAQLKEAKHKRDGEARILLLGSGDSGKSTICKQMRLITRVKWSRIELESYRQLVFSNLIQGMLRLLENLVEARLVDLQNDDRCWDAYKKIQKAPDVREGESFPIEYFEPLRLLWSSPKVQDGLLRSSHLAFPDNVTYFFPQLDRLFEPNYKPSTQDILQTRSRTTGIVEYLFDVSDMDFRNRENRVQLEDSLSPPPSPRASDADNTNESSESSKTLRSQRSKGALGKASGFLSVRLAGAKNLHMIDVGGQRAERRKWIHCFEDVTAILFLASLSGYDQCLFEAKDANQMLDAMMIWDGVCSLKYFKDTNLILLLNKEDLFQEKVMYSPIKKFFPDYNGADKDAEAGREYFKKRFLTIAAKGSRALTKAAAAAEANSNTRARSGSGNGAPNARGRQVYVHFTTAVNTTLVTNVMVAVADIVLRSNFAEAKLI